MTPRSLWAIFVSIYVIIGVCNSQNTARDRDLLNEGIKRFSLELLYSTANETGNHMILSPITVWTLMTLVAEGASGVTLDELKGALRLPREMDLVRSYIAEMVKSMTINTTTVALERTSMLIADSSANIEPSFYRTLKSYYPSREFIVNFKDGASAMKINQFVSLVTHGKINTLVSAEDLFGAKLILADAIYFRGQWATPFNKSYTRVESFNDDFGNKLGDVNMMYMRDVFPFANVKSLRAFVLELPYGEQNRFSMIAILPYPRTQLAQMFLNFQNVTLNNIFAELKESSISYVDEDIDVWLPRFKITADVNLHSALNFLGIYEAFDPILASLPNLSKEQLYISKLIHKAEIEVTEEGTVAAAVTASKFSDRKSPPKFKANRPFVYMIIEKITNTVVFGGIYSKPSLF